MFFLRAVLLFFAVLVTLSVNLKEQGLLVLSFLFGRAYTIWKALLLHILGSSKEQFVMSPLQEWLFICFCLILNDGAYLFPKSGSWTQETKKKRMKEDKEGAVLAAE